MNTEILDPLEYRRLMLERTRLYFDQGELDRIAESTVAIAGFGGVGAITAELLARWGVGKFRLLDKDAYEYSNLNRQLFATPKTLGVRKVQATEMRLREINPHVEIELSVDARVDNRNVHDFVKGADIVIQNTDHPSSKLFYLAARTHKVPLVNGYATITGGRVQSFDYRVSSCSTVFDSLWNRIKFSSMKPIEEMSIEELDDFDRQFVHSTAISINFVTNTVGCMVVAEAIKLISGKGKPILYPKYLDFDLFDYMMQIRNSNLPTMKQFKKVASLFGKKLSKK